MSYLRRGNVRFWLSELSPFPVSEVGLEVTSAADADDGDHVPCSQTVRDSGTVSRYGLDKVV